MVKYTTLGRILGFLMVLGGCHILFEEISTSYSHTHTRAHTYHAALPAYAIFNSFSTSVDRIGWYNVLYFISAGFILGLVEVPSMCSCYEWCKVVGRYTRILGGTWIGRAATHIALASGMLALAVIKKVCELSFLALLPFILVRHLTLTRTRHEYQPTERLQQPYRMVKQLSFYLPSGSNYSWFVVSCWVSLETGGTSRGGTTRRLPKICQ